MPSGNYLEAGTKLRIVLLFAEGVPRRAIASRYGVTPKTIRLVLDEFAVAHARQLAARQLDIPEDGEPLTP